MQLGKEILTIARRWRSSVIALAPALFALVLSTAFITCGFVVGSATPWVDSGVTPEAEAGSLLILLLAILLG